MRGLVLLLLCAVAIAHADLEKTFDNGCPRDPLVDQLFPHEECNLFYQCFHGSLVTRNCASGLHFNPENGECDWPENAKCAAQDSSKLLNADLEKTFNNGCPRDPLVDQLFPHEECNLFYQCFHGSLVTRYCAPGLHFNPENGECDWPENAKCAAQDNSKLLNADLEKTFDNGCPRDPLVDQLFPHEECELFYQCHFGSLVPRYCAPGLHFNPELEICDWPENANCAGQNKKELMDDDADNEESELLNNSPDATCAAVEGILINHEDCNKFYRCANGQAIEFTCPSNLLWNPSGICDWPENVNCGNRNTDNLDLGNNINPLCRGIADDGTVAHENCNRFNKCVSGQLYPMECPSGLYYNDVLKICDWPYNVECGNRVLPAQ